MAAKRVLPLTLVVLGSIYVAWLSFMVQTTGDYPTMFAQPMNALLAGHVGAFFAHLPTDGAAGSVLLRAPGALIGKVADGSQLAIFRFGAFECVLAAGILGLWLARGMRERGAPLPARLAVVGLCVLTPALLNAIRFGHPEEVLGAVLCVAAVLLAAGASPGLSGLALGLAMVNKPWAVFAVTPALLAAPGGRLRLGLVAAAVVAAWSVAAELVAPAQFAHSLSALSVVAHPQELWWPLARLRAVPGVTPAYFLPDLVSRHARELAVALIVPLSVPLARRPDRTESGCLALLALLLLVRCVLDPSNHVYYQVPLVIALVAWEARSGSAPVLAGLAAGMIWVAFHALPAASSLEAQFAGYLAAALWLLAVLSPAAFGTRARVSWRRDDRNRGRRQLSGRFAGDA